MAWTFDNNIPIYQGIIAKVELFVLSGEYAPGSQLPPVRELAELAGVNPNTAQRAYAELEASGLIDSQRTAGRFVTTDAQLIEQRRKEAARKYITEYFAGMQKLGFTKASAAELLNAHLQGGK